MNAHRERRCPAPSLPASLAPLAAGRTWFRDQVGESGGAVYRLHGGTGPNRYLKQGRGPVALDVADEFARLTWLAPHVPVPTILGFVHLLDEAWLMTEALPGRTAFQQLEAEPESGEAVVDALARFLRRWHAIPVTRCPFNSDHQLRLAQARDRLEAGLVATDEFDEEREGWTARQVWDAMEALLPFAPDRVVTHGDFSLDNLLLVDGEVVGCIDVGRAGVADRYQDLAILWNCLGEFDSALQQQLVRSYGLDGVDEAKLRFHLMLDEFF